MQNGVLAKLDIIVATFKKKNSHMLVYYCSQLYIFFSAYKKIHKHCSICKALFGLYMTKFS